MTASTSLSFGKSYKLKSRKTIELLFAEGSSHFQYPLKLQYLHITETESQPIKFSVTVPKKKFKTAVSRNHLKRKIRESFRLNFRSILPIESANNRYESYYAIMFIYVASEKTSYQKIEKSMLSLLNKLAKTMQES